MKSENFVFASFQITVNNNYYEIPDTYKRKCGKAEDAQYS